MSRTSKIEVPPESFSDLLWHRSLAQDIDRRMSAEFKLESAVLMERAGLAVATTVHRIGRSHCPVIILAGPGNNGGDALVAARHLTDWGYTIFLVMVSDKKGAPGSSLYQRQVETIDAMGIRHSDYEPGIFEPLSDKEPIVIDGIFGIGFKGPLAPGPSLSALKEIARIPAKHVIAVDVPSGLDCDDGGRQDVPLHADVTVTFGAAKPAHVIDPARDMCGIVTVLDIGFLKAAELRSAGQIEGVRFRHVDPDAILEINPWRELPDGANKYDRGHVLVIGGSVGKTGAPIMAATAALRTGAGWATMAVPSEAIAAFPMDIPPELTLENLFQGTLLDPDKFLRFAEERRVRAVVCGPGCMAPPFDENGLRALVDFSRSLQGFVVIDAGATTGILAMLQSSNLKCPAGSWLLTPHPGEWGRLGTELEAPLSPLKAAPSMVLARQLGISLMYKNASPIICSCESQTALIVTAGSKILARAGSGDVLAGIAAAHGAIGLSSLVAGARSLVLSASAADRAARKFGANSVLARDIIDNLGPASDQWTGEEKSECAEEDAEQEKDAPGNEEHS